MNKRRTRQPSGVILDAQTLGADIDLEPLKQLEIDWQIYRKTEPGQTLKRVEGAEVVLTNKVVLNDDLIRNSHSLKYIGVLATGNFHALVAWQLAAEGAFDRVEIPLLLR